MLASIASRPRLAAALVTLVLGTPFAVLMTGWGAMLFATQHPLRMFGMMEAHVAVSAAVAPCLAGLWLRAPTSIRKQRAQTAAILATAIAWSAMTMASGVEARTTRALAHGIPLVSIDYLRFVTEDFRILWTLWLAGSSALLVLFFGSLLTLFTPWFASAYIGVVALRLVERHGSAMPPTGPLDPGHEAR